MFKFIKKLKIDKCLFLGINGNIFAMKDVNSNNKTIKNKLEEKNKSINIENNSINIIKKENKLDDKISLINNNLNITDKIKSTKDVIINNVSNVTGTNKTNNINDISYKTRFVDNVSPDGNCLFNLMSNLFFGKEDQHGNIRSYIYKKSKENQGIQEIIKDENMKDEFNNLEKNGVWGSDMSVAPFAEIFSINVALHNYVKQDNIFKEEIYLFKMIEDLNSVIHIHRYKSHFFYGSFNLLEEKLNSIRDEIIKFIDKDASFKKLFAENYEFNFEEIKSKDIKEYNKFPKEDKCTVIKYNTYNINNILSKYISTLHDSSDYDNNSFDSKNTERDKDSQSENHSLDKSLENINQIEKNNDNDKHIFNYNLLWKNLSNVSNIESNKNIYKDIFFKALWGNLSNVSNIASNKDIFIKDNLNDNFDEDNNLNDNFDENNNLNDNFDEDNNLNDNFDENNNLNDNFDEDNNLNDNFDENNNLNDDINSIYGNDIKNNKLLNKKTKRNDK